MDECVCSIDGDGWVGDGWWCVCWGGVGGGCIDGWLFMRWWRTCVVVMYAVRQRGSEVTRLEPQDLSVTVELGLCLCSRLPSKIDNQTEVTRGQSQ